MRLLYSFPSRSRKEKFFRTLENIQDMSASSNYEIIAKLDNDDEEMNNDEVRERLKEFPETSVKWGLSKGKIDAVNRSLEDLPLCDIIIILSDDIQFDVFGFDDIIREAFQKHFPALDGTVHFPDDNGKQNTIIVSMVGVNLYKELGYLYHPFYESVYADDDFTNLTKRLGKYVFINKRLFSHNHPIWNKGEWDSLYRHSERPEVYKRDRDIFENRKANNFEI